MRRPHSSDSGSGSGSGSESEDEDSGFACDFCGKEFDALKGATFHENFHCKLTGPGRGRGARRGKEERAAETTWN